MSLYLPGESARTSLIQSEVCRRLEFMGVDIGVRIGSGVESGIEFGMGLATDLGLGCYELSSPASKVRALIVPLRTKNS